MAEDYTDYITQGAIARGLDPRAALRTVDTEGGRSGKVGDSGTSFGPFQMHVGGTAPGTTAKGLGDAMLAQGLDPKNPYQSIDFALDYAKAHGGTFSPDIWHGLRGGALAPGESRWMGAPSGGGSSPLYLGTLEKNFHQPTGNDLLDALLNLNVPKEDKTGNPLLDQLMQQAMLGAGPTNQAQPAPDAAKALGRIPQALPPQTVPELSGQQVDIKPLQPLQPAQPAQPPPVPPQPPQQPTSPPEQFIEPPAKGQQVPPPVQPRAFAPQAQPESSTGNGLLDHIFKQLSPISTAQAAEMPTPMQPPQSQAQSAPPAAQSAANLLGKFGTPQPDRLLQQILNSYQNQPPATAPSLRQLKTPGRDTIQPSYFVPGEEVIGAKSLGEAGEDIAEDVAINTGLGLAGKYIVAPLARKGMELLRPPMAQTGDALGRVMADQSGAGRVPQLPAPSDRIEPPPIGGRGPTGEAPSEPLAPKQPEISPPATPPGAPQGEARLPVPARVPGAEMGSASRTEPGTALRPFAGGGGGPPAIPPTGVARIPGGEPPPEQPDLWREGRSTVDEPRPPKGDANESGPVKQMRLQAMHSTQDQLFKLWQQGNAYINKFLRQFSKMPQLTAEENLQIERYMEWQPGMPQVAISSRAKRIVDEVLDPARRQAAEDFKWLHDHDATEKNLAPEHIEDLTEGYLHRMRAPTGGERHPFDPFAGRKSLRQSTASQKQRKWFVVQDMNGNRHIYRGDAPPPNTPIYQDSVTGKATFQEGANNRKIGEVRRATMEEVEKNTDTRYVHNPILATLQNMAQLHLARKNVELMKDKLLPELTDQGLVVTNYRAARQLSTVRGRPWRETNIPALRGYWFEPRLADAFDDFYRTPSILSEDLQGLSGLFTGVNRVAVNTLFLNPFGHMNNVTSDAIMARGHLWFDPLAYPGFAQTMRAAFSDVWNRSPFYYQVMKAGGSTMGASFENRILYQALADRARFEMTTLPHFEEIAKATGVWPTAKAMGEAIWNASQKFMWGYHDMLLMQNVREQMMRNPKLSLEQAVMRAERFIADYRVPATVEGREGSRLSLPQPQARTLSRWMQDRSITVFGRYHYNKLKANAGIIRDLDRAFLRSGMSKQDRLEAAGRLGATLIWSNILMYGLTAAVRAVTGNPNAQVHVPGAAGIPANAQKVAQDLFQGQLGQAGWDAWMTLASIITPVPAAMEIGEQVFNRSYPGGPEIRGQQLPAGKQIMQGVAHAGRALLPPVGDLMDWRRGLQSTTGIHLPPPGARPPGTPYINKRDRTRQNRAFNREFGKLGGLTRAPTFGIPPDAFGNPKE